MDETNVQPESPQSVQNTHSASVLNAEWLASLSHELRGPLTAIQGYTNMLLRYDGNISSEERHEFLQAITRGGDRIAAVLDRFLDIANLEAGTTRPQLHPVDMIRFVQDIFPVLQENCPDNDVKFTFKQEYTSPLSQDQGPFVIQADGVLIRKLLLQLLDNAQKYAAKYTPIEITLSYCALKQMAARLPPQIATQFQEPDQQFVELSIQDQGIGISLADQERIFERFERVDMQLTREISGLGLGLTMCRYIVALHHGAIWVESVLGKGSTFHVLFPIKYAFI